MLTKNDELVLKSRGITPDQIEGQLKSFEQGFPYLEIKSAAGVGNGIVRMDDSEVSTVLSEWEDYLQTNAEIIKFVPASGAASRMFKDLFEFVDGESDRNNFV